MLILYHVRFILKILNTTQQKLIIFISISICCRNFNSSNKSENVLLQANSVLSIIKVFSFQ